MNKRMIEILEPFFFLFYIHFQVKSFKTGLIDLKFFFFYISIF